MTVSTNASSGPNKTISPDDIVTLQVRQKTFTIRAGTLAEDIHFFEEVFFGDAASSMQALQRTAEGAYIVEADPKIFKHIINYCLFLTGPLFYEKGHFDYAKYAQLLQLARFFQVPKLANWIENKGFERAITTTTHMENCPVDGLIRGDMQEQTESGAVEKHYLLHRSRERVWRCPRGKSIHQRPGSGRSDANACGKECAKVGEGNWEDVEDDVLAIITKKEVIDFSALAPAEEEVAPRYGG